MASAEIPISIRIAGYPNGHFNSGMFHGLISVSKFIPYTPTMNVKGMKMVAITVRVFMTSFIRLLMLDIASSMSPERVSR